MTKLPFYLTRYYQKGDDPFQSLNDLPFEKAQQIKRQQCIKRDIGGFYACEDYLVHRRAIEKWIYGQFALKGGKPACDVPVYMCLGPSPQGNFDVCSDMLNPCEIRIPLDKINLAAVSFTYPDSMYELVFDTDGIAKNGKRTNTPTVYLFEELECIADYYFKNIHYIEAQVWDREMLQPFLP